MRLHAVAHIIATPRERCHLLTRPPSTVKKRYRKKCKSAAASMVDSVLRMYVGVQGMEINRGIALPANGGRRTITCRGWVISVSQLSTRWCTMSWNQRLRFSGGQPCSNFSNCEPVLIALQFRRCLAKLEMLSPVTC